MIGGGPAGLVVASVAAQAGLRVTLIEKTARLGGDCLHTGCVPSKTLLHQAQLVQHARVAAASGLLGAMPDVDFSVAMGKVRQAIEAIQAHDDPERFRGYGVDVRFGAARFTSPQELAVDDQLIRARYFVIATGSEPAVPPVYGLEEAGFDTSDTIFGRNELPARLAVLGGGPVGVELAQAFARFGSRVTLIELKSTLLPGMDALAADTLRDCLVGEGIEVITGEQVASVRRDGDSRQLAFESGATVECDRVLVATGRRPVLAGLGLEAAGVQYSRAGVTVDRRLRTAQHHIFAAGDVCGPFPMTHMAEYQAGIVLANTVFRIPARTDYRVVPQVVYTDPEIATVGLDRAAAERLGIRHDETEFALSGLDRAITEQQTAGFARILLRRGRIAGATVVAPHAGELIHELALAMQVKARARDVSRLVHAYPSYAQLHRRTLNLHYASLLKSRRLRLLVWLLRLLP